MKDVYYAFSSEFGSFVGESKFAKELDKYLFYDEDKDIFFDKDGNEVDVAGYNILPRTGVYQAEKLVDAIYKSNKVNKPVTLIFFEKLENHLLTFFLWSLYY